jgi:hypothetical protein
MFGAGGATATGFPSALGAPADGGAVVSAGGIAPAGIAPGAIAWGGIASGVVPGGGTTGAVVAGGALLASPGVPSATADAPSLPQAFSDAARAAVATLRSAASMTIPEMERDIVLLLSRASSFLATRGLVPRRSSTGPPVRLMLVDRAQVVTRRLFTLARARLSIVFARCCARAATLSLAPHNAGSSAMPVERAARYAPMPVRKRSTAYRVNALTSAP